MCVLRVCLVAIGNNQDTRMYLKIRNPCIKVLDVGDFDVAYNLGFKVDQLIPCIKLHMKLLINKIKTMGIGVSKVTT